MPAELACHQCGRPYSTQLGGDLTCSDRCAQLYVAAQAETADTLSKSGFVQSVDIPNLWEKGGAHVSADQVIKEGIDETLARHSDTLAEIASQISDENIG